MGLIVLAGAAMGCAPISSPEPTVTKSFTPTTFTIEPVTAFTPAAREIRIPRNALPEDFAGPESIGPGSDVVSVGAARWSEDGESLTLPLTMLLRDDSEAYQTALTYSNRNGDTSELATLTGEVKTPLGAYSHQMVFPRPGEIELPDPSVSGPAWSTSTWTSPGIERVG